MRTRCAPTVCRSGAPEGALCLFRLSGPVRIPQVPPPTPQGKPRYLCADRCTCCLPEAACHASVRESADRCACLLALHACVSPCLACMSPLPCKHVYSLGICVAFCLSQSSALRGPRALAGSVDRSHLTKTGTPYDFWYGHLCSHLKFVMRLFELS